MNSKSYRTKKYLIRQVDSTPPNSCLRDLHQEYLVYQNQYPRRGSLKVQTLTAQGTFPVEGVQVEILKTLPSGIYTINTQKTDASGLTKPIQLPTLARSQSLTPGVKEPFITYDVRVTHPDFTQVTINDIPIYEGLTTLQPIEMTPKEVMPMDSQSTSYTIKPPVV